MANPRINIKSIDYFKFKKLLIDCNRDDYNGCSKEVKALCDCVQTLKFRDEEFDDESDRSRFEESYTYYKQILASKRIDPLDMRIKSGWWGDHKNAYSAGKIKPAVLKDTLVAKTKHWAERHSLPIDSDSELQKQVEGPGLYVLKHREHQCFQYVGRADKIFVKCAEKLKAAFEGGLSEPLAALLVISMSSDWDFYFTSVAENDDIKVLRILENDLILKHDSIWPHGLNFRLHIDSLLEVSEFRKSCQRHHWPPGGDVLDEEHLDIARLRKSVTANVEIVVPDEGNEKPPASPAKTPTRPVTSAPKPKPSNQAARPSSANPKGRPQSATNKSTEKVTPSAAKPGAGKSAPVGGQRPTTPRKRPTSARKPPPKSSPEDEPSLSPVPDEVQDITPTEPPEPPPEFILPQKLEPLHPLELDIPEIPDIPTHNGKDNENRWETGTYTFDDSDEDDDGLLKSVSQQSLDNLDYEKTTPVDFSPQKSPRSPGPFTDGATAKTSKTRVDKSRLPVAGGGKL